MSFFKDWGCYPPEYNREIHGPYNPTLYYGKRDVLLRDVKIKDFFSWLGRRNKSPRAIAQACGRKYIKYVTTWVTPKKPGVAFLYHLVSAWMIYNWVNRFGKMKYLKKYKYH